MAGRPIALARLCAAAAILGVLGLGVSSTVSCVKDPDIAPLNDAEAAEASDGSSTEAAHDEDIFVANSLSRELRGRRKE